MKQINARIWRDRDILGLVAGITAIGIFIGVCLCCVVLLISHAEAVFIPPCMKIPSHSHVTSNSLLAFVLAYLSRTWPSS